MSFLLRSARYLAQDALRQSLQPGAHVVDATMGNGHDTCFLAELVGRAERSSPLTCRRMRWRERVSFWKARD